MMRHAFGGRARPPWWPANEPWPPRRHLPAGRRRFFRRAAVAAILVVALGAYGAFSLASMLATSAGLITPSARGVASLLFAGAGVGAGIAAVLVIAFARRVALPIGAVMDAADRVADGDYAARVAERGPMPVRGLARSFNTMAERLQSHDRLRRDLMADVAHELRTPLTVMQGKLEGLIDGVYPRDERQLAEVLDHTHLLSRLVEDLRTVALTESGGLKLHKEFTDVVELGQGVVRAFDVEAKERGVTLAIESVDAAPPVSIDPVRVREVLGNLLSNAVRHTPSGGRVTMRIANGDQALSIEVRDTGAGMSADELARAFERFYKGADSHGSGLGLTIARNLVRAHGGEMTATSRPGVGTTISFTLPRA
jgi:two-component system OmpR family sensor kinase/two-component system sensor histidine kinase BaeS